MTTGGLQLQKVEAFNKAGLALLAQLHRRAFTEQDERPWSVNSFEQLIVSPGVEAHLFVENDQPVGFSLVRSVCDEADLISIAVDPAMQGKGRAGKALQMIISELKSTGIARLFLEVREDNIKAIQLYRSLGFKKIGERASYYQTISGKKLDAHVFSLIVE